MAIAFGKDGNPVTATDLSKYGLSMPVIEPNPRREYFTEWDQNGKFMPSRKFTVTFPDLAEPVTITPYMDRKSTDWKGLYRDIHKKSPAPTE